MTYDGGNPEIGDLAKLRDRRERERVETRHQAAVELRAILATQGHQMEDEVRKGLEKILASLESIDDNPA